MSLPSCSCRWTALTTVILKLVDELCLCFRFVLLLPRFEGIIYVIVLLLCVLLISSMNTTAGSFSGGLKKQFKISISINMLSPFIFFVRRVDVFEGDIERDRHIHSSKETRSICTLNVS